MWSDSYEYYRSNAICKELKKKYGPTFGENKDKVKVDRLKGRSKTRREIYLAVQGCQTDSKRLDYFPTRIGSERYLREKEISPELD